MKKAAPYIIGSIALLLLVALLANRYKPQRRLDERITLRQRDKIPYGTAVAKGLLWSLFPQAVVYNDTRYPGSWDNIDPEQPRQAVVLVADYLMPTKKSCNTLIHLLIVVIMCSSLPVPCRTMLPISSG
jgi:hypothetical protein